MQIEKFPIDGPLLIRPKRFVDYRGWFSEIWNAGKLSESGFDIRFVQDNLTYSAEAGTLRGLHFQVPPASQGKLVMVLTGAILDVAVDLREGSSTYARHVRVELTSDGGEQLYVPEGFAHGFVTTRPGTRVLYKVTCPYAPEHDRAIAWNDPELAIDWGTAAPIQSAKDEAAPRLRDVGNPFYADRPA